MKNLEDRNKESLERQRETRERRDIIREEKDALKSELQGVTSTEERRSIKADWLARGQAAEARRQKTKEIANNKDDNTGNRPIIDNGVDGVPRSSFETSSGGGGGDVAFNGSVLICIDGSPYYIDIPYDSDTGPYAQSAGANFPISAP